MSTQDTTAPLTLDDAAKKSAATTAQTVMKAWAAHHDDKAAWWAGVQPHLSQQASQDYEATDPRNIGDFKIEDSTKPRLMPSSIPEVAHVGIMTDKGEFDVMLTRSTDDPTWRANRIDAPEQGGL